MSSHRSYSTAALSIESSTILARVCSPQRVVRQSANPPGESTGADQPQSTPPDRSCASTLDDRTIQWKLFNLVLATVLLLINIGTCELHQEMFHRFSNANTRRCLFRCHSGDSRSLALYYSDFHTPYARRHLVPYSLSLHCGSLSISQPC
ncbi:uncharacterized protein BDV14DRAFT_127623 [Aspergillus stella-maris]|uniref:uncharacterized protein n=1 Tax=Aspergillus stella-maris TaxID=1810926 RepID=UPI003CCD6929